MPNSLLHDETISLILSIGLLLIFARIFGEFFRKLKIPLVVGELVAGILLGPTLLGNQLPGISELFYSSNPNTSLALNAITSVSVIMLLFVAGMEVDLTLLRQQGKVAIKTSISGLLFTLTLGISTAYFFYDIFGTGNSNNKLLFSLFIGTAMAVTALPVIARTLMDLGIFRTRVGSIIITAAMFDDLTGWILFSVILGMLNDHSSHQFFYTLGLTIVYAIMMLSVGRLLINKALPYAERKFSWPGGFISISLGFAFLGAAFTEYIGIHAIFGAFIMGIAFGDSEHLKEKTREILNQFVTSIFAPLFFITIGFKVNFAVNFDLQITSIVLALAIFSKLIGAGLGAYWGGLNLRESLAVGFGMNARGAMEIILATLALQAGLISQILFVSIIIMAVLTSIIAGPMLQLLFTGEMKIPLSRKGISLPSILKDNN